MAKEPKQRKLFDWTLSEERRKFNEFHADNPQVWQQFKRFAFKAINAGMNNFSSRAIFHRIRWETNVESKDGEFKINNNLSPFYARKFADEFPKYEFFFRNRKSKADETP